MKTLLMLLIATLALGACTEKGTHSFRPRPVSPKAKLPPPQKLDECPSAEGRWGLSGGVTLEIGRHEGYLAIQHPDLSGSIIMDGETRKLTQASTGSLPEVTGTCSKQTIQSAYNYEGRSVQQSWVVDLEKDSIVITEKEGANSTTILGSRR